MITDLQLAASSACGGRPALAGPKGPALGKQWSRDYSIDVPAMPTLPNYNLRYQEALDWRKKTREL